MSELLRAYASERRRPELTTILSGARGTGKTTLLSLLSEKAEASGWIAVGTTALPGLLDDIEIETRQRTAHLLEAKPNTHLTGIGISSVGSISFEQESEPPSNWRSRMSGLLDELNAKGVGLLITVDEVDPNLSEMIQLAAVYQHFVRENRKVALLMAGLPYNISALLNDKTVSFLRRAQTYHLGRIADYDIEDALIKTIHEYGRDATSEGIGYAVKAIAGFPFLMQLVGYRSWDVSPESASLSLEDFRYGAELARKETEERILEATYRELSDEDLRFLKAMLEDEGETRISDLVTRLDRSSAQVAQYRRRLIEAGVIGSPKRGIVVFELPFFREFLEERM